MSNLFEIVNSNEKIYGKYIGYIFFYLLIVFLVFFIVYELIYHFVIVKKHTREIQNSISHTRYFSLNFNTGNLTYFDKEDMSKQTVTRLDSYIASIKPLEEQVAFKNWIDDFRNRVENPQTFVLLDCPLIKNDNKKIYSTMVKLTDYNYKSNILHFEANLLPSSKSTNKFLSRSERQRSMFSTNLKEVLKGFETKKYHNKSGYILYIKLNLLSSKENDAPVEQGEMTNTFTSIFSPLKSIMVDLNKNRRLALINENEAVIIDFNNSTHSSIESLASHIINAFVKYFKLSSLENIYSASISIVSVRDHFNLDEGIKKSLELLEKNQNDDKHIYCEWDPEARKDEIKSSETLKNLDRIIHDNKFEIKYTPVISTFNKEEYYAVSLSLENTTYDDVQLLFADAKKYNKLEKLLENIFDGMYMHDLKPKQYLLFPIPYKYSKEVRMALNKAKTNKKNLILCFPYSDINSLYQANSNIEEELHEFSKRIKIGLELDMDSSDWTSDILSLFSTFILTINDEVELHNTQKGMNLVTTAINLLKPYNKVIIIDNLDIIADVTCAYSLGLNYFICKEICIPRSTLYQPDSYWKKSLSSQENTNQQNN